MNRFDAKTHATLAILLAVVIGGGVPVTTKIALKEMPSFSFTFFRFIIAGVSILPFLLKTKPKLHKNLYKVILLSLFMSVNVILFPLGVHLTTATIASTLYIFGPIIIAIFSYFLLAEKFTIKKTIGIIIGFLGALVIILLPTIRKGSPFNGNLAGNLLISIAVIATALYTVFSKEFQKNYTPLQLTGIFIFTTCIILIPLAGIDFVSQPHWWRDVTPTAIISIIYAGLLGTTIWYLLYQYSIQKASPLIASMVLYLQPAATFLWALTLLGEHITVGFLTGAVLAFVGVFFTLQAKK